MMVQIAERGGKTLSTSEEVFVDGRKRRLLARAERWALVIFLTAVLPPVQSPALLHFRRSIKLSLPASA